jgi:hypothetical protein
MGVTRRRLHGTVCLAKSRGRREWEWRPLWGRTSVTTHPKGLPPGDLVRIITPEQAAPKARGQFDARSRFVPQAADAGLKIATMEGERFRQRVGLGRSLLTAFLAQQGDGGLGPEAETAKGRAVRRCPNGTSAATSPSSAN